ncbi:transposase, MuDR, MULE transposase domain protein [Tanacetum coccineum]
MDTSSYNLNQLNEEVLKHYQSNSDLDFSILFLDKHATKQSFIELNSDENFMAMFSMYEKEKEITIFVTTDKDVGKNTTQQSGKDKLTEEPHGDGDSDYCMSDESYYSHISSDDDGDDDHEQLTLNCDGETSLHYNKSQVMKVNMRFPNATDFRRALDHYAVTNEFDFFIEKSDLTRFTARCKKCKEEGCQWRIHASVLGDKVTFKVKKMIETHTCTRSNKGGNRRATQGWIADIVKDKLKSDGDISVTKLRWEDSFIRMDDYKEQLLNKNPGSVVDIEFETNGGKKCFKRKFTGVLAAATCIDGNNSIFPVAFSVLESENKSSWTWFLELVKKAIWTPDGLVISFDMQKGLEVAIMEVYPNAEHRECSQQGVKSVKRKDANGEFMLPSWKIRNFVLGTCIATPNGLGISSDMQKGLEVAIMEVYPNAEHRECIRHLYSNFKKKYRGQPQKKIMKRFDKKRRIVKKWNGTLVPMAKNHLNNISKNLGEYEVSRSNDNKAEVKFKGKRWEVILDERKCTCRVWQVKGIPCVHAVAFIAFTRDTKWEKYVDPFFTIEKFKEAYALEVAPIPGKNEWAHIESGEKIYPPVIKRPIGRPRKNRIKPSDEQKRRKTCKNPPS